MCEFFISADPILYESRSRTVRIHGVLTSIRLENLMWDTLAEIAAHPEIQNGMNRPYLRQSKPRQPLG